MWIIAGLGNPGLQYAADRHNIGFRILDALCEEAGASWSESRYQSMLAKVQWPEAQQALLVKPLTYMNLSGQALLPLCQFYGLDPMTSKLLVIHDDLELAFGRIRLKRGGGESGHRGLLSISEAMDSREYLRLRFGISRPPSPDIAISDYVLSPFEDEEEEALPALIRYAIEALHCCCCEGETQAMNQFNRKKQVIPDL